jgi:hypothetical protein
MPCSIVDENQYLGGPFRLHHDDRRALNICYHKNLSPWPESASELYRLSDHRLLAKLVPTFADRGCHVVNMTNP